MTGILRRLPTTRWGDWLFHTLNFQLAHGRRPRSRNGTFLDAMHYVKLVEAEQAERQFVSDKALVKLFVTAELGAGHTVPTLALVSRAEDLADLQLPDRCVLKPTHASGRVLFRCHGEAIDADCVRAWLDLDYYVESRERNYRNLKKRVIVEPLVFDMASPDDYKFLCWNGRVYFISVTCDRFGARLRTSFFDRDWTLLPISMHCAPGDNMYPPKQLARMIAMAERLARHFSFIRVDMYEDGERVLVGELTNVDGGALDRFGSHEQERHATRLMFGDTGFSRSSLLA